MSTVDAAASLFSIGGSVCGVWADAANCTTSVSFVISQSLSDETVAEDAEAEAVAQAP